ncbi:hypothetical protein A1O1_07377 [Capronia coronata CBS 617.96]|uniref:Uncharacterized protein n=1 Tax=Capronia coronata CBS 617.96 TaxID=1182541 RepID=W9Y3D4_9EURO|nr:uncharacterized protein A1O1_07377 [Capronia coronata CBS 617.96]EXJ83751.1 hypothetical protein A1O1_07377 [Capronia coronata CBS 617.96]
MEEHTAETRAVQQQWLRFLENDAGLWEPGSADTINVLYILINLIEAGPATLESPAAFNNRIHDCHRLYQNQQDVVGRLQEEREPRYDAGDDENR